jgi:hypothetical protein
MPLYGSAGPAGLNLDEPQCWFDALMAPTQRHCAQVDGAEHLVLRLGAEGSHKPLLLLIHG